MYFNYICTCDLICFLYLSSPSDGSPASPATTAKPGRRVKVQRRWDNSAKGAEAIALDYSGAEAAAAAATARGETPNALNSDSLNLSPAEAARLALLKGSLQDGVEQLKVSSDEELEDDDDDEDKLENGTQVNGDIFKPNVSYASFIYYFYDV